jgi:hypothetical protein
MLCFVVERVEVSSGTSFVGAAWRPSERIILIISTGGLGKAVRNSAYHFGLIVEACLILQTKRLTSICD